MNFSNRLDLAQKVMDKLLANKNVVITGDSFDYEVLASFMNEYLKYKSKCSKIEFTGYCVKLTIEDKGFVYFFNINDESQVEKFSKSFNSLENKIHWFLLIEDVCENLRDKYNSDILPILMKHDEAKLRVIRN